MGDIRIGNCRICGNGLISGSFSDICPSCNDRINKLSFKTSISYDEARAIVEDEGKRASSDGDFDWGAALGPQMTDEEQRASMRTGRGRLGSRSVPALDLHSYTDDKFIDDAKRLRKEASDGVFEKAREEFREGRRSIARELAPGKTDDEKFEMELGDLAVKSPTVTPQAEQKRKQWVCSSCSATLADSMLRDAGIIEGDMKPICPRCGNVMEYE